MTSTRSPLCCSSLALLLTVTPGCEIAIGLGDVDDTSTGASTGEGMTSTTVASSASTDTADETTAADDGTTADGESTSGDSGETEAELCGPPYEDLFINVYVNDEELMVPPFYIVVDADCVVESVVEDGSLRTYALVCDEDGTPVSHGLEVSRNTGPIDLPMTAGTPVHLALTKDFPIDYGGFTYLVIRDAAGEIVLAHHGGGDVPDEAGVDLAAWFAPLEHALVFGQCEPVPADDPGMSFIQESCPAAYTRLSVGFQLGRDALQLFERTSGQLGALSVLVTSARHLDPVDECDLPIDGYSFVAYREG